MDGNIIPRFSLVTVKKMRDMFDRIKVTSVGTSQSQEDSDGIIIKMAYQSLGINSVLNIDRNNPCLDIKIVGKLSHTDMRILAHNDVHPGVRLVGMLELPIAFHGKAAELNRFR